MLFIAAKLLFNFQTAEIQNETDVWDGTETYL